MIHHVADHADPSATPPVSDPLSEAGATAWHLTSESDASAQEQPGDGALSALALTNMGATVASPDSLSDGLQDLSVTALQSLNATLTDAGQTIVDLVQNSVQLIDGATAAFHDSIGDALDPALGSVSSVLGVGTDALTDVTSILGEVSGTPSDVTSTFTDVARTFADVSTTPSDVTSTIGTLGVGGGTPGDVSSTLGQALGSPSAAEATPIEVPAALTAETAIEPAAASLPMIDAHPLVSDVTAPVQVDTAPLQLGFLGQSYVDSGDPHDGAFSAVGVHGFV